MEDTRERILQAAHAVFSTEGYRGATTRRIAAEAGVNEVTLFRLFETKEDLLAAAVDHAVETSIRRLHATALPSTPCDVHAELRDRMRTVLQAFQSSAPQVRTALAEWGQHPGIDERRLATARYLHDEVLAYMREAQRRGLIREDVAPEAATAMVIAPLFAHGLLHTIIPGVFGDGQARAADAYLDIALNGLQPAKTEGEAP